MSSSASQDLVVDFLVSVSDPWICIDGGWGVDALLGRQTRLHEDLDLVIRRQDKPAFMDRLGALGFNSWRLFEIMQAVPGSGAVLHTANPRLHESHLGYTVRHAQDRAMLVDLDCLVLAETIAPACPNVRHWILLCQASEMPAATLSDEQIRLLVEFLHALTDPASLDLRGDVPMRVPSGLPVED